MKNLAACLVSFAALLLPPLASQAQNWQWVARTSTHTRGSGTAVVRAVATDVAGNSYVVGVVTGTVHFGASSVSSPAGDDGFVAKLNSQGQWQWVRTVPAPGRGELTSVAVLASGDVVVVGTLANLPAPITLGPSTLTGAAPSAVPSLSTSTTYVAQLSAAGAWQWATQAEATSSAVEPGNVTVDAAGNTYVSGGYYTDGDVSFGTTTLPVGAGWFRAYVASLNPLGQWRWATNQPGSLGAGSLAGLAFGGNTLYVGGEYVASGPVPQYSPESSHALLAGLDPATGAWRWSRRDTAVSYVPSTSTVGYYQPVGYSTIKRLAADAAGNVVVLGKYYGRTALEGCALPSSGLPLDFDYAGTGFLTRFNAQGVAVAAPLTARPSYLTLPDVLAVSAADEPLVGGMWEWVPQFSCGTTLGGQAPPLPPAIQDTLWLGNQRVVGQELQGYVAWTQNGQWQSSAGAMAVRSLAAVGSGGEFIAAGDLLTDVVMGAAVLTPDSLTQVVVARFNPAAPVLTGTSSPGGLVGATLTLTGNHLTGTTQVLFNGVPATFTVVNGTTLTVTVPAGATTGLITVLTPQGGAASPQVFQVGSPLGLSALAGAQLALWPNPARDIARLTVGETPTDVLVLDGVGRVVWRVAGARGTVALPVADLPAGTYTVRAGARVARLVRQ